LTRFTAGFVSFVATLNRSSLRRQFGLFGWIHMSLLLIVVSSHFIVNNILEGMIWFWVPVALVIINDIAAYVFGMAFGRHQLIKLSPKKTVEGFVGAFFFTMLFAYVVSFALLSFTVIGRALTSALLYSGQPSSCGTTT
jgi:phosphatidate cytidylyltransferase